MVAVSRFSLGVLFVFLTSVSSLLYAKHPPACENAYSGMQTLSHNHMMKSNNIKEFGKAGINTQCAKQNELLTIADSRYGHRSDKDYTKSSKKKYDKTKYSKKKSKKKKSDKKKSKKKKSYSKLPPNCENAYPSIETLWPPNHKMKSIYIKGLSKADVSIQCIRQDEPLNSTGDGNTEYDGKGISRNKAYVRAERQGGGNGRVYYIDFTASNKYGECQGTVQVGVPPSKKKPITDDGPLYISVEDASSCIDEPVNEAPVAQAINVSTQANTPVEFQLIATDADNDPLTFQLNTLPQYGNAQINDDQLLYSPILDFVGVDTFTYIANDGELDSEPQTITVQVTEPPNIDPQITSTPILTGITGHPYQYQIEATDPDQPVEVPLSYELLISPTGMTLQDNQVDWIPTQSGIFPVSVQVTDARGGTDQQDFTLTIAANQAPVWNTTPETTIRLGDTYIYDFNATDPDGDTVEYALISAPTGMSLNGQQLLWIPTIDQVGVYTFRLLASDGYGGETEQSITLEVQNLNTPPVITSEPPTTAYLNESYVYTVTATDAEEDPISFEITTDAEGMSIDPNTGIITWTPTLLSDSPASVEVQATDSLGGLATQSFTVSVITQGLFSITSTPDNITERQAPYFYPMSTDADVSQQVEYTIAKGPEGAYFNGPRLEWVSTTHNTLSLESQNQACGQYDYVVGDPGNFKLNVKSFHDPVRFPEFSVSLPIYLGNTSDIDTQLNLGVLAREASGHLWGFSEIGRYTTSPPFFTGTLTRLVVVGEEGEALGFEASQYSYIKSGIQLATEQERALAFHNDVFSTRLSHDLCETPDNFGVISGLIQMDFEECAYQDWGEYDVLNQPNEELKLADLAMINASVTPNSVSMTLLNRGLINSTAVKAILLQEHEGVYEYVGEQWVGPLAPTATQEITWTTPQPYTDNLRIVLEALYNECQSDNHTLDLNHFVVSAISRTTGATEQQSFWVATLDNDLKTLSSIPSQAYSGAYFTYTPVIEGGVPPYSVALVQGPPDMSLTEEGILIWPIPETEVGTSQIQLSITDASSKTVLIESSVSVIPMPMNEAPEILSTAPANAYVGEEYRYQLVFQDPEGDEVTILQPDADAIDDNYLFTYTPTLEDYYFALARGGIGTIAFELMDSQSNVTLQTIQFNLHPEGTPKVFEIETIPSFEMQVNESLYYQVEVTTVEENLTYDIEGPQGLAISATGLITWQPDQADLGPHIVKVTVSNGSETDFTYFVITVIDSTTTAGNVSPSITSLPTRHASVDTAYNYQVEATDPNGDTLLYLLEEAPLGMQISPNTGLVSWTPDVSQIGRNSVVIRVDDGLGLAAIQYFSIIVNTLPSIDSLPPLEGRVGSLYEYAVQASDAEGDPLSYRLLEAPAGMSITTAGVIQWIPQIENPANVRLQVSDGFGAVEQSWTISVLPDDRILMGNITLSAKFVDENDPVTIQVTTENAVEPLTITATLNGSPLPLDTNFQTTITATGIGDQFITATITDARGSLVVSEFFTIRDPADTEPPVVEIHSPLNNTQVTQPTDVTISVQDANLRNYRLVTAPKGPSGANPDDYQVLASGDTELIETVVSTFDPTLLMNGYYELLLEATDMNGQVSTTSVNLIVEDEMKIGHFRITFEDLTIDLAGIPIQVTRTYDSRQRFEALDFGYGWSIDYQNVRVQESRTPGFAWSLNQYNTGLFPEFCVEPNGNPEVSVRLPNGDLQRFLIKAAPECSLVAQIDVSLVFEPLPGTYSTLELAQHNVFRLTNGNLLDLSQNDLNFVADPSFYRLTTKEGMVYYLDQNFGIEQVEEPNGAYITYSDTGIVHSAGYAISFERNEANQITAILLPDGRRLDYHYTEAGDLQSVIDLVGSTTTHTYLDEHYLEEILDPRGVRATRMEYDEEGRLVATIDAAGNRIEYEHDLSGNTQIIRDRRGNATVLVYNERGYVTQETNPLGETRTRTYTQFGDMLTDTNDLGETTTYTWDDRGNQTSVTDPLGNTTLFTYTSNGEVLTETDPLEQVVLTNTYRTRSLKPATTTDALGQTTSFIWDDTPNVGCTSGALRSITDAEGNIMTMEPACTGQFPHLPLYQIDTNGTRTDFVYNDSGWKISETTYRTVDGALEPLVTLYRHDAKGRIIETTYPDGSVMSTEYNNINQVAAEIDALDRRTEFTYDNRGQLILTTYPDGTTESKTYDANGNLTEETDRLGRTTLMFYDAVNRVIETEYPDGSTENNEYDAAGRLSATIDANGNRTEFVYDTAGRRVLVRDALGNETQTEYDERGLRTAMIDANNNRTEFVYDAAEQMIQTIYADGTSQQMAYDTLGRVIRKTDERSRTIEYGFDAKGNLVSVTDELDQVTSYTYDEQNNKLTQTDALNRTTAWAFDNMGRTIRRTLPLGQIEEMAYDLQGRQISHTDFNGAIHHYSYSINNDDLSRIDYQDGSFVEYLYTDNRLIASATTESGRTDYTYDDRDRILTETQPNDALLEYQYDSAGNRTQVRVTLDDHTPVTDYTFDALNRLASVTDANGIISYTYDPVGNRDSMTYPNDTLTLYTYDSRNRLTQLQTQDAVNQVLQQFDYQLDATGRRTRITESSGRVTDYQHDVLYRLTGETITDPVNGDYSATYTYDAVGNRIEETVDGITTGFFYDDNDRLTQTGGTRLTYDDKGNTLTETLDGVVKSYAYNDKNQMVQSNISGVETQYAYNHQGIRQSQVDNLETRDYVIDSNRDYAQVLMELDSAANLRVSYTYGDDLISQDRAGAVSYYHYDGLGSTRGLSDASSSLTDTYHYQADGQMLRQTGVTENDYLFAGEQFDTGLNQYYLRARYYNQDVARFTQMDSWMGVDSDPFTLNKYVYANADPTNWTDPSGLFSLGSISTGLNIAGRFALSSVRTIGNSALQAGRFISSGASNTIQYGGKASRAVIIRLKYMQRVKAMKKDIKAFRHSLKSVNSVSERNRLTLKFAKKMHGKRRALGRLMKQNTPEPFKRWIFKRNINKHNGDPLGPKFEDLLKTKTPDEIIDSSVTPSGAIKAILEIIGARNL